MQHLDQIKQVFIAEKAMSSRYLMRKYKVTHQVAITIIKILIDSFGDKTKDLDLNRIIYRSDN
jgi:hypothetical protein